MRVSIYTAPQCQPCRLTKKKFDQLGIAFEEVPVSAPGVTARLHELGYSSAPVVEVDCGGGAMVHWSGFRPSMIEQLCATLS